MTRRTKRLTCYLLLILLLPVLLSIQKGCSEGKENAEKEHLRRQLELSEARYEAARRELDMERAETEAARDDFYVAATVCFCSVLAVFLLLQLLLREQMAKRALVRFLQWVQRRSRNGK